MMELELEWCKKKEALNHKFSEVYPLQQVRHGSMHNALEEFLKGGIVLGDITDGIVQKETGIYDEYNSSFLTDAEVQQLYKTCIEEIDSITIQEFSVEFDRSCVILLLNEEPSILFDRNILSDKEIFTAIEKEVVKVSRWTSGYILCK